MRAVRHARRGRPLKFGRPSRLLTLTLPADVVDSLTTLDRDVAWAIVKLCERARRPGGRPSGGVANLARISGGRALILVDPAAFQRLPGVSVLTMADGRGLLALDANRGAADLEVAVTDRLEQGRLSPTERHGLTVFRGLLRQWRAEGIEFVTRSIIVAQNPGGARRSRATASGQGRR